MKESKSNKDNKNKNGETLTINSFLDYLPQRKDFSSSVQIYAEKAASIVKQLKGTPQLKSSDKATLVQPLIAELKQSLGKTNRAYRHELYFLIGYLLELSEDTQGALQMYEQSLGQKINNPLAQFRHAAILSQTGRCPEAVAEWKEITWRTTSLQEEVLYSIAQCQFTLEQDEQAFKTLNSAIDFNSKFLPARRLLIEKNQLLMSKTSDPELQNKYRSDIANHLNKINQIDPEDRETALTLAEQQLNGADLLLEPKRLTKAENIAKHFAENSDYKDDRAVAIMVEVRIKQQRYSQALKLADKGLTQTPDSKLLKTKKQQAQLERKLHNQDKNEEENGDEE